MAHFFKKEWIEHKEAQLRLLSYTPSCLLKIGLERAVVVAQWVERSLPIPEVCGLIPVIGKNSFIY